MIAMKGKAKLLVRPVFNRWLFCLFLELLLAGTMILFLAPDHKARKWSTGAYSTGIAVGQLIQQYEEQMGERPQSLVKLGCWLQKEWPGAADDFVTKMSSAMGGCYWSVDAEKLVVHSKIQDVINHCGQRSRHALLFALLSMIASFLIGYRLRAASEREASDGQG